MKIKTKILIFINVLFVSLILSGCFSDAEKLSHNLKYKRPTYVNGILIVNKGLGLPSNYDPGENQEAMDNFDNMKNDAKKVSLTLRAFSTYRDYDRQKYLYDNYMQRDGKEAADTYSARPGFSEHQTGLAFDIGNSNPAYDAQISFENTKEFNWLKENAHKYGFILRYPENREDITGFKYEPWHFRYVGEEIAVELLNSNLTLDEYLNSVFPDYN